MIELITGTPGAGKTLMCVSRVLRPMVGSKIADLDGVEHERRLCIGGVTDLLLPHEPITVRPYDPEKGQEPSDGRERKPGDPPLTDCEMRADNWFQWCLPGDVIVIDECQRLFRPMASGRKLPLFIAMLETHRHYGVDIVLITQHPQLIHANVRALVGKHRHVRRLFGGLQRMVYEWDQCTAVDRRRDATAVPWRPDKSAYQLYKSAEMHTKSSFSIPVPVIVALLMVVVLPVGLYFTYNRVTGVFTGERLSAPLPKQVTENQPKSFAASASVPRLPVSVADSANVAAQVPAISASTPTRLDVAGCITLGPRCACFDSQGYSVKVDDSVCRNSSREYGEVIPYPVRASVSTVAWAKPADSASSAVVR